MQTLKPCIASKNLVNIKIPQRNFKKLELPHKKLVFLQAQSLYIVTFQNESIKIRKTYERPYFGSDRLFATSAT
ncbi:MAG: hypothetical protein RBR40_15725, partial [Tenuifilaceae bacterium]|nr:hypothetical protein [Tenuifilaceae bacterium]